MEGTMATMDRLYSTSDLYEIRSERKFRSATKTNCVYIYILENILLEHKVKIQFSKIVTAII